MACPHRSTRISTKVKSSHSFPVLCLPLPCRVDSVEGLRNALPGLRAELADESESYTAGAEYPALLASNTRQFHKLDSEVTAPVPMEALAITSGTFWVAPAGERKKIGCSSSCHLALFLCLDACRQVQGCVQLCVCLVKREGTLWGTIELGAMLVLLSSIADNTAPAIRHC